MAEYRIDSRTDGHTGHEVFRVWQVIPGEPEDVLVGEYETLRAAKASVEATWRPPDRPDHLARAFDEGVETPADDDYRP